MIYFTMINSLPVYTQLFAFVFNLIFIFSELKDSFLDRQHFQKSEH